MFNGEIIHLLFMYNIFKRWSMGKMEECLKLLHEEACCSYGDLQKKRKKSFK